MILFVFEGEKRERQIFETIEHLFFPTLQDKIINCYSSNIYSLYNEMTNNGSITDPLFFKDIVHILKERNQSDAVLQNISSDDISETYLFFDYELQHEEKGKGVTAQELNIRVKTLLNIFNDETGNGKLYINYPTVESIRYTKELPDSNYNSYSVSKTVLKKFKSLTDVFSFYKNLDFLSFRFNKKWEITNDRVEKEMELKKIGNI